MLSCHGWISSASLLLPLDVRAGGTLPFAFASFLDWALAGLFDAFAWPFDGCSFPFAVAVAVATAMGFFQHLVPWSL